MITSGPGRTASEQELPSPSNRQIERVLAIKAYLQLAWQLSRTPEDQALLDNMAGLQTETREAIEAFSNVFKSTIFEEENLKVQRIGRKPRFLEQDSTIQGASQEQQAFNFLKEHPSIKEKLFSEGKIEVFELSKKKVWP